MDQTNSYPQPLQTPQQPSVTTNPPHSQTSPQQPPQQTPTTIPTPPRKSNLPSILILIIVILISLAGGYFLLKDRLFPSTTSTTEPSLTQPSPTPIITPTPDSIISENGNYTDPNNVFKLTLPQGYHTHPYSNPEATSKCYFFLDPQTEYVPTLQSLEIISQSANFAICTTNFTTAQEAATYYQDTSITPATVSDYQGLFVEDHQVTFVQDHTTQQVIQIVSDPQTPNAKNQIDQILSTLQFISDTQASQEDIFCGGIAGIACPSGYTCQLDGTYPDAGGTCISN